MKVSRNIRIVPLLTVVALGKRNIPFRGHTWNKETKRELIFFINWKAKFDPVLKSHLSHCSKNATYTSSVIQNELIKLAGDEVKSSI